MRKLIAALATATLFAPVTAFADPPTGDQVKAVWDFFEHGQGQGPVLGEGKLCTEISKGGDNKNECTAEVPAEGVKAGTIVYVWQAYMVPEKDEVKDLSVQVKQDNTIRETKDVDVIKGTYWRQRTWSGVKLAKAGNWTISIMRGDKTLKSWSVKVQ
ncbi:MAG: hypothetical protein JST54_33605 [Deltaproteobacteria bacterium]|nr:hypothetical protein [Deltaproteobacteria bacterium]